MSVTTLVDAEIVSLYDEIMLKNPMLRTSAEESFIEHVGERLFLEVADEKDLIERDMRSEPQEFDSRGIRIGFLDDDPMGWER